MTGEAPKHVPSDAIEMEAALVLRVLNVTWSHEAGSTASLYVYKPLECPAPGLVWMQWCGAIAYYESDQFINFIKIRNFDLG